MKEWIRAAAIRSIKTAGEAALSMLTIGQQFFDVDWLSVLSVSAVAAIIALLTCIVSLPEVDNKLVRNDDDRSDDAPNFWEEEP